MKVIFVSSGNSAHSKISPFIKLQGDSLTRIGVSVGYFSIKGKGIKGYLKNINALREYLKIIKPDIVHAHYALSGWVSVLAARKIPVIVSYMGSDVFGDYNQKGNLKPSSIFLILATLILQPFPNKIIVKSENLLKYLCLKDKVTVIPNGVNLDLFKPVGHQTKKFKMKYSSLKKRILFLGNIDSPNKNFKLVKDSIYILKQDVEIVYPYPVPHYEITNLLNKCDVLVLASHKEGSPNIIKEAMACNCPIVSTDVGDVRWVLGETEGCYISSHEPQVMAEKIKLALEFGKRTKGRQRIIELGLDSESVAQQIVELYKSLLNH